MSRIHTIDSLAHAASVLVEVANATNIGDVGAKANETAKAIMEKIQELLKEQDDD